ncbi:unnamed protein product [Didymodactylos carnosus]|uniref:Uncharacterized protein n=1 Tax=Didymodactylos carnosus TaxID=1234261 RepID=A0A8S2DM70_9BILA|nr:unnamed protein product [Didymodactylos carnosus]CAF3734281.1 unnamed protein product [Didymodactylos carnosus]
MNCSVLYEKPIEYFSTFKHVRLIVAARSTALLQRLSSLTSNAPSAADPSLNVELHLGILNRISNESPHVSSEISHPNSDTTTTSDLEKIPARSEELLCDFIVYNSGLLKLKSNTIKSIK